MAETLDDRLMRARAGGATWDQIHTALNTRIEAARAAGATQDQINTSLGYSDPTPLMQSFRTQAQTNMAAHPPAVADNPYDAFINGLQSSSGGLIARGRLPDRVMPDAPNFATRIANMAGVAVGDIPAMIQGGFYGGRLGALVPGAGETGESEAIGAGAGAFALPQAIKSGYLDALNKGQIRDADDFIQRYMGVLWDTTKAGVIGGLTGGAGKLVENAAVAQGTAPVTTFMAKSATELATMTTAGAAMQGKLPSREDFIDGAILLAAFHVAGAAPRTGAQLRDALQRHWRDTDEPPLVAAQRAAADPAFRAQLFSLPHALASEVRGASSTPVAPPEQFKVDNRHTADLLREQAGDQPGRSQPGQDDRFVLPRGNGGIDHFTGVMRNIEGGTEHGDLSRPRISPAGAVGENQIMPATGRQYGLKGTDAEITRQLMDPNVNRLIGQRITTDLYNRYKGDEEAMLAAYNAGPRRGDQLQRQGPGTRLRSEVDPHTGKKTYTVEHSDRNEAFLPMETQRYLADARRVAQGKGGQLAGSPVMDHRELPLNEEPDEFDAALARVRAEEGEEQARRPSLWERFAADESGSLDPWEAVGSRMADADKGPSIFERLQEGLHNTYLELFNPGHPIRRLVDAATTGGALPSGENPEFLYRFAEHSATTSKYMIERNMVDPDGNITGPGLRTILDLGQSQMGPKRFWTYAIGKWAVEKAGQSKETGVEVDAARRVVEEGEAGGIIPPGEDLDAHMARIGTTLVDLPAGNKIIDRFGPHFDIAANRVRMLKGTDAEYEAKYGKGLTYAVVKAHEIGHAIAYSLDRLTEKVGRGDWTHLDPRVIRDLTDELTIVSRRYKPGLWRDAMQRTHVTKQSELIADAIATWMTDPVARTRMPEFENLIRTSVPGFDIETLGAKPGEWGTPMQRAFQQLQDFQNATFRYLYKSGAMSRETYLQSVALNAARIPGYRELDGPPTGMGTGPGKTAWNPVKEFFGSDRKVQNILQSLLQEAFLRIQLADFNTQNRAIFNTAQKLGDADPLGAAEVAKPVNYDLLNALGNMKDIGMEDEHIQTILQNLGGAGLRHDEVPIFEDGKMRRVKFNDPDMVRLLRGYDATSLATWQKVVAAFTKVQRTLIVMNPLFPLRLIGYDVPWQFITTPGVRNTVADFFVGLGHVMGNKPMYDEWLRSGGAERVFDGLAKNEYIKKVLKGEEDPSFTDGIWNVVKTPYEALRVWGSVLGQAQRVGRYVRGRQQGEEPDVAAVNSSEASFHRIGFGGPHAKSLNAMIPFFTAYLNSLEKTARGFFGIGRTTTGMEFSGKNLVQFHAKAIGVITMLSLAQWYHDRDKEWYKAAPEWQKDNGLFIHIGPDDGTGHTFFYKFPPLISFIYGGLPRRLAEAFIDDNPHAFDGMGASFGDSLLPPGGLVLYNVFLPIIEHVANHSFFHDTPLVDDNTRRNVMPAEQYNQYSSGLARNIARFASDVPLVKDMKLSPPVVDNYLNGWGGTLGTAAIRATDQLTHNGPWKPGAPLPRFEDMPLASSWQTRYPSASAEPIKMFGHRMDDFDAVHGSLVRALEHGDLAQFTKIARENPTAAVVHAFNLRGKPIPADKAPYLQALRDAAQGADIPSARLIMQAQLALKNARDYAARVYEADNLSPADKRQILDATYAQMQVMAERANDVMDRSGFDGYHAGRNTQPNPDKIAFQPPQPGI